MQQEGRTKTKDPTTTHVKEIAEVLKTIDPQRKGVNLFRLFINPDSFAQSVENLFYTSFLVKEGRVAIDVKDDGEIVIRTSLSQLSLTTRRLERAVRPRHRRRPRAAAGRHRVRHGHLATGNRDLQHHGVGDSAPRPAAGGTCERAVVRTVSGVRRQPRSKRRTSCNSTFRYQWITIVQ